ncbi:MAG TPA: helix-turn-helix domain-containing protein [Duganella sp.]|nr:helix-turn-helix domain-containing protein [Duganella sp.]
MIFAKQSDSAAGMAAAGGPARTRHHTTRTSDLCEHERVLTGWHQTYDQLSKGKFSGRITEALIGDVQLFEEQTSQAVFETGPGRSGVVALGVFSSLEGEARWRGHAVGMDHVTALSDHASLELCTPPNCTMLSITVPVSLVTTGEEPAVKDADQLLLNAANHVHSPSLALLVRHRLGTALRTMALHPQQFAQAEARDQLASELVGLVDGYLCLATAADGRPDAKKALHVVARAREYIEANPERPITVLELCARTRTARRTLQDCFTQVTGMSPAAYLKAIRLNGFHRSLKHAAGAGTIADIAATWGFWHMSQLSLDYKRLFGELPSETFRAALRWRALQ